MKIQHPKSLSFVKKLNWSLVVTISTLLIIGLINLYSVSHRAHSTTTHLFYLQLIWMALGFAVFFSVSFINYHFFTRIAYFLYGINVVCLITASLSGKRAVRRQKVAGPWLVSLPAFRNIKNCFNFFVGPDPFCQKKLALHEWDRAYKACYFYSTASALYLKTARFRNRPYYFDYHWLYYCICKGAKKYSFVLWFIYFVRLPSGLALFAEGLSKKQDLDFYLPGPGSQRGRV